MALTRAGLLRLRGTVDARNWRPHLLVFSGAPSRRWHLIAFADAISHRRALMTISTVLTDESITPERQRTIENTLSDYLQRRGVHSLIRSIKAPDPFSGVERLVEAYGLGSLSPNTVLIGDSEYVEHYARYSRMIASLHEARRNVVILHYNDERQFGLRRRIDVWWGGLRRNGGLMITLSYLLQTSQAWRGADIRIKMIAPDQAAAAGAGANLEQLVANLRTRATSQVVVSGGRSFEEIFRESSRDADLVFLGMREPEPGVDYQPYYEKMRAMAAGMPTTAFVLAAEDVPFGEILFKQEG
jgi:hypothetical protein